MISKKHLLVCSTTSSQLHDEPLHWSRVQLDNDSKERMSGSCAHGNFNA
jgi:hypothetical protein